MYYCIYLFRCTLCASVVKHQIVDLYPAAPPLMTHYWIGTACLQEVAKPALCVSVFCCRHCCK